MNAVVLARVTNGKIRVAVTMMINDTNVATIGVLVFGLMYENIFGIRLCFHIQYIRRDVIITCTKIQFMTENRLMIVMMIGLFQVTFS